ncbi:MAG: MazG nucleotide pyrophosphohydrolase domain-containing protein [Candidatus Komeilibacteria bacterium]
MKPIKKDATMKDYQEYVKEMEVERGFSEQNVLDKCLILGEEVGELFKAVRKDEKIKVDHNSKFGSVDEEIADIIIMLCAVANRYGIDMEEAFRNKEEINGKREWK